MRAFSALLIAAALVACRGTEPDGLRLDITLNKTALVSTDSVRVQLRLTNVSPRTVKVLPSQAYGICYRAFEVYDAGHRPVSIAQGFCIAALTIAFPAPVDLGPGEQIAIQDWWHPSTSLLNGQPLSVGTYRVRGRATIVEGDGAVHSALRAVMLLP
jgi:hypothetical protein